MALRTPSKYDVSDVDLKLIQAVCQGDADAVRLHINEGAQFTPFFKGRTLISQAAAYGHADVMRVLIEAFQSLSDTSNTSATNSLKRSVEEEVATPDGMRELQWDTEIDSSALPEVQSEDLWSRQYRWYAEILDKKEDALSNWDCRDSWNHNGSLLKSRVKDFLSVQDPQSRTTMHYAAESGCMDALVILLDYGCNVNVSDVDALTPLHLAAFKGHLEIVEALLAKGAAVNAKSTDKLTPLHYASSRGHVDVVQTLVARGANLNSLDSGERTPLALAASEDLFDVAEVLIRAGAKPNTEDIKGYTPLSQAVWMRNVGLARLLIENGAKLIPCNNLLHDAILHRHFEMVELLVNSGALLNAKDNTGTTPLLLATRTLQHEVVRLLLERGASVDLSDRGLTPLMVCFTETIFEDLRVVKALLDSGADFGQFAIWSFESDAFTSAMLNGKTKSAILLLAYGAKVSNQSIAALFSDFVIIRALVATNNLKLPSTRPSLEFPNIAERRALEWLETQRINPLSLLEQSRIAVRLHRPPQKPMYDFVRSLDLPLMLKRYLMLSEFFNKKDLKDILDFD